VAAPPSSSQAQALVLHAGRAVSGMCC
jgi:hypothetical protein